jgi:hypothetical protein
MRDSQIPPGADGPQTLQAIQGISPEVRCIFMIPMTWLYHDRGRNRELCLDSGG